VSRTAALRRVGLVVLGVNLARFLAKAAVWTSTGSVAVGSEAVNSLVDAVYSLIVVVGLYLTTRPADRSHPHGHERIEPLVALVVAVGVFAAGAAVLWNAVGALTTAPTAPGPLAAGVLAAGALVKYGLFRYCLRVARAHGSPALRATAMDNRADVLTAGAALTGVLGAVAGYPVLDPLAGAVVAVGILWTGIDVARDNLAYLLGAAPAAGRREAIVRRALAHPGVEGVHDVVAHYVGPEVDVSLHVEVDGDLTIEQAHAIETAVVESIIGIDEVDDAYVHLDPRGTGEWEGGPGDGDHSRSDPDRLRGGLDS
jgi:cation diffusion facilitator family transporter